MYDEILKDVSASKLIEVLINRRGVFSEVVKGENLHLIAVNIAVANKVID